MNWLHGLEFRFESRKSIEIKFASIFLGLFKRHRDSPLPKLKPRSFPVHEATGNFSDSQRYVSDMPILLEIKTAFGPEDTAAMTAAFEEALKRLNIADREAPMATSVAKKIVRLAKKGECNPTRLTEGVVSSFVANPVTVCE